MSYLHFHKTYGQHTWQTGELSWGTQPAKLRDPAIAWPLHIKSRDK